MRHNSRTARFSYWENLSFYYNQTSSSGCPASALILKQCQIQLEVVFHKLDRSARAARHGGTERCKQDAALFALGCCVPRKAVAVTHWQSSNLQQVALKVGTSSRVTKSASPGPLGRTAGLTRDPPAVSTACWCAHLDHVFVQHRVVRRRWFLESASAGSGRSAVSLRLPVRVFGIADAVTVSRPCALRRRVTCTSPALTPGCHTVSSHVAPPLALRRRTQHTHGIGTRCSLPRLTCSIAGAPAGCGLCLPKPRWSSMLTRLAPCCRRHRYEPKCCKTPSQLAAGSEEFGLAG
jgi:hypothetical protein